jgi:DNA primase large subunit
VFIQKHLEVACFEFAQRAMPSVLQKNGWDYAECVELNIWSQLFLLNSDMIKGKVSKKAGKSVNELFESMARLRHATVHRHRMSMATVIEFLLDAESFSEVLKDEICTKTITRLRREAQKVKEELERHKTLLEFQLTKKLAMIASQRADLDRQESTAVANMIDEDNQFQISSCIDLFDIIHGPITAVQSPAPSVRETSSEEGTDVESYEMPEADLNMQYN